jgi:multidrug efflux system outer membrane protein
LKAIKNKLKNIENNEITSVKKSRFTKIFCFKSARAEYTEVLRIQREALDSKIEMVETKKRPIISKCYHLQIAR